MTFRKGGICAKCRVLHPSHKAMASNHWNWKGGRYLNHYGYIYKYAPEYPGPKKGKYVLEHRLVWEEAHNKSLPKGWVIHHINNIKTDNRLENLYACRRGDHTSMTFLKVLQKRIRALEKELTEAYSHNHLL